MFLLTRKTIASYGKYPDVLSQYLFAISGLRESLLIWFSSAKIGSWKSFRWIILTHYPETQFLELYQFYTGEVISEDVLEKVQNVFYLISSES